jgi:nucleoside-diphosphate-sugar epimerase
VDLPCGDIGEQGRVFDWDRIINVGSGHDTSANELAASVTKVVGQQGMEVLHSPAESGGVSHFCADISVARKLLDYEPPVDLEQGLRLSLERDPRFQR